MYGSVIKLPVLGPVVRLPVRAVRAITWQEVAPDVQRLHARVDRLEEEMRRSAESSGPPEAAFSAVLGGLWDTTASLQTQIQGLWQRLEFVRAETMFEMRAQLSGGAKREIGFHMEAEQRVKSKSKVEASLANGTLRLNVGCGHIPMEEYTNVDGRDLPGVDIVSDASEIPLQPGTVAEIFSSHLLEHFPLEHFRRVLLPHWFSLLRSGGIFRSIVPDAEGMIDDYVNGRMSFDDLREVTYGLQEYDGDFHFNMFSRNMIRQLVSEVGFQDVAFEFIGRKNGKCRDMEIRGIKP